MYRYIRHISTMLAAVAMTAMLGSCSTEDIDAPRAQESYTPGTQLVINLAVPETMETASAAESRTAGNDENYMDPTGNEGKINSLRLMGFLRDGSLAFNRTLLIPSEMPVNPNGTAIYEIRDVRPGDYHLYLVANLDEYVKNVANEAALKQVIVNMDAQHPLTSGNLPMVYEPDHYVTIPESASTNPDVELLSLKFACVKVKYDLLFDKAWNSDIFGDNGMVINDVTVSNVATSAYLVTNKAQHAQTRDGVSGNGSHYDSYTETPANASKPNVNVIGVSGKVSRPTTPTTKWAYEGILYLPERYATDKQTTLNISATVTDPSGADGTVASRYTIPLGGYDDDEDCKELPRGTYYEVIAKIKTLGDAELDATIVTKDWMESKLSVDMVHTYLTLSKDAAEVESLKEDVISYDTDGRGTIGFECVTKLPTSSKAHDVIMCIPDVNAKTLTFKVNPAISITSLSESEMVGTAECYITAGNIRKLVRVKYDIKPFFTITPLAVKIQIGTSYEGLMNTKIFEYETNLEGIKITQLGNPNVVKLSKTNTGTGDIATATDRVGNSTIELSFASDATYSKGRILVKALSPGPATTTLHYFGAYPKLTEYASLKEDLQVTVMPPLGAYRIYFRAINDYMSNLGGISNGVYEGTFLGGDYSRWPKEDYTSYSYASKSPNWNDWWNSDSYDQISTGNHRIYIYAQFGETTGPGTSPDSWHFNGDYNAGGSSNNEMIGDNANPGWYYYDLESDRCADEDKNKPEAQKRKPEPGKTLMIFNAHRNGDLGYEPHRASHHLDPGISLFDYEDREGWILYDPTSDPYYRIYDEKPYIEDVTFTVYSPEKVTGWYQTYGVAENNVTFNNPKQWTMKYTLTSSDYGSDYPANGKIYHVSKIKLKCAHGDYEKAIKLKGLTSSTPMSYAPAIPVGSVRVYYRSDNWGNDVPNIYVYRTGAEMTAWGSAPAMKLERVSGGKKYYYYDVPSSFASGNVIFQTADRKGQDPESGGYKLSGSGNHMIYKGPGSWNSQSPSALPTPDVDSTSGVMLFGGRSFESQGHVGTYENGVWKAGRP